MTEDPLPPSQLQPQVPRDLETICLKCLEKEPRGATSAPAPGRRPAALPGGKPIQARPTPSWERPVKWTRRHPGAAMVLAVSTLAAAALLASTVAYNAQFPSHQADR